VACIKDELRQTRGRAEEYAKLSAKLGKAQPARSYDLMALSPAERTRVLAEIGKQYKEYTDAEKAMETSVPAISSACGPSASAWTDDETCDIRNLTQARQAAACDGIGDTVEEHEQFHRKLCLPRREHTYRDPGGSKDRPGIVVNLAQKADEEAAAYRVQAISLQALLRKVERNCMFRWKTTMLCRFGANAKDSMDLETTMIASVCGDPGKEKWTVEQSAVLKTNIPGLPANKPHKNVPYEMDCVELNGDVARHYDEVSRRFQATGSAGNIFCTYQFPIGTVVPKVWLGIYPLKQCLGAEIEKRPVAVQAIEGCTLKSPRPR
jgi:hypothetical protein